MEPKTREQLIAERVAACPEETGDELAFNALAGHVRTRDGMYLPYREWHAVRFGET